MASSVLSPVVSQCQAVAGRITDVSFSKSGGMGRGLTPMVPQVPQRRPTSGRCLTVSMAKKKVNAYNENWSKGFFGQGYFSEKTEKSAFNIVKSLEKKKLLTGIEKTGLLSRLDKLGVTLSGVEKLGLLSKAEKFGVLGFLESFAATDPSTLASLSLPFFVGALLFPILIPDDPAYLVALQYTLATISGVTGGGLFVGSIVIGLLQED